MRIRDADTSLMFWACIVALLLTELFGLTNNTHPPHYFFSIDPNSHSLFFAYAVAAPFAVHVQFHGRQGHVVAAFTPPVSRCNHRSRAAPSSPAWQ